MRLEYFKPGTGVVYRHPERDEHVMLPPVGTIIRMPRGTLYEVKTLMIDYDTNSFPCAVAVVEPYVKKED